MAVTEENSTQVGRSLSVPPEMNDAQEDGGRARIKAFDFTQGAAAGDANSVQVLAKMPAGKVRVLRAVLVCSAFGASRVLSLGHGAYKNASNATVVRDEDKFAASIDVSGAATKTAEINTVIDNRGGFLFLAQVTGGTIPAGATLNGYVEYVVD
jgi:hypothetical protein